MTAMSTDGTATPQDQDRRRAGYRWALIGAAIGILGALLEAAVGGFWATDSGAGAYQTADYWFTASALPAAVGPLLVMIGVRRQQLGADGRLGLVGVLVAGVCLTVLVVVIVLSLVAGHDVQGGPSYVLGTLGAVVGMALFAAGSWRVGLVPRWILAVWPIVWAIGSFFAVSASPLLLVALYIGLLLILHRALTRSQLGGAEPDRV